MPQSRNRTRDEQYPPPAFHAGSERARSDTLGNHSETKLWTDHMYSVTAHCLPAQLAQPSIEQNAATMRTAITDERVP